MNQNQAGGARRPAPPTAETIVIPSVGASPTRTTRVISAGLPAAVTQRIDTDPALSVVNIDRSKWFDPATAQAHDVQGNVRQTAIRWFMQDKSRVQQATKTLFEISYARWLFDLNLLTGTDPRFKLVETATNRWINPFTSQPVTELILQPHAELSPPAIQAIARYLAAETGLLHAKPLASAQLMYPNRRVINTKVAKVAGTVADPVSEFIDISVELIDEDPSAIKAAAPNAAATAAQHSATMLRPLPTLPGLALAAHCAQRDGVGGDFYEASVLADGRLLLALGDVSGHGMQGALVASSALKALRMLARTHTTVLNLATQLNESMIPDLSRGSFITCFIAIIDPDTLEVECVHLGHHPTLIINPAAGTMVRQVGKPSVAVGLMGGDKFADLIKVDRFSLQQGDRLFQYSDGLAEERNAQEEEFGIHRVAGSLLMNSHAEPQDMIQKVAQTVHAYHGRRQADDDITMLALHCAGA